MYDMDELEAIMNEGVAEVECPVCGYFATVEPDADYPCPECGEGRLVSPLIEEGLI
jgi:rubrerythrin